MGLTLRITASNPDTAATYRKQAVMGIPELFVGAIVCVGGYILDFGALGTMAAAFVAGLLTKDLIRLLS